MKTLSKIPTPFRDAIISFSLLTICVTLSATKVHAQDVSCFDNVVIEPSFIAFTTSKHSKLADWYQATFGLEVVKEFSFPDGSVNGVLMRKGELVIEVFRRDDVLQGNDYVKNAKPGQWQGVMKSGVFTNANLLTLKECLIGQGVKAGRIFNDEKLGIDLLHVIDLENNTIEIISRQNRL